MLGKALSQTQVLKILKTPFLTVSGKNMVLSGPRNQSLPFSEFVEPGSKGYFVFYDRMGASIDLYFEGNLIYNYKNRFVYPRIAYPYLFLFSSDLSRAELYLLSAPDQALATLKTEDSISAWSASEDGRYAILGDLSGSYHIFDRNQNRFESHRLKESRINYIKGVEISSSGEYSILGSLHPEIFLLGHAEKGVQDAQLPSGGRAERF